jgi:hypothetical protein
MAEKPTEFWNLDLTRLTWTGWLLMLLTVGTVLGALAAGIGLMEALGFRADPADRRKDRWLAAVAFVPAAALGCGVFEGGRRLLQRAGMPITRPEKR